MLKLLRNPEARKLMGVKAILKTILVIGGLFLGY
jgi:hypothetical protein